MRERKKECANSYDEVINSSTRIDEITPFQKQNEFFLPIKRIMTKVNTHFLCTFCKFLQCFSTFSPCFFSDLINVYHEKFSQRLMRQNALKCQRHLNEWNNRRKRRKKKSCVYCDMNSNSELINEKRE